MTTAVATRRAALYLRVSDDRSGRARSVEEQEADGRRDCDRAGWEVVDRYVDNSLGASRHSKVDRPEFRRLKTDAAAGRFDVIVVWEASRLQRDLAAYVELRDLCRRHGIGWSYNGRLLDLDDADDAFTSGLDALLAEREAEYVSKRTRRAMTANAAAGRVHGALMIGYRRIYDERTGALVGQEPDPVWAPIIREMFERVARGESLTAVAKWMHAQGLVLPRTGSRWTGPRVQQQLKNRPAYLGHRVHRGEVVVRGAWPALIDETTYDRVQAILSAPGRRPDRLDGVARGLMSGLMRCAVCHERVGLDSIGRAGERVRVYRCEGAHASRQADRVDRAVEALLLARLSRSDAAEALSATPSPDLAHVQRDLEDVRQQLAEVEAAVADRTIKAATGLRLLGSLEEQAEALERQLRPADQPAPLPPEVQALAEGDVRERWDALPLASRRKVARALLHVVMLHRVGIGVRRSLGVTFRWEPAGIEHELPLVEAQP